MTAEVGHGVCHSTWRLRGCTCDTGNWVEVRVFLLLPRPAQECMGMELGLEGPVLSTGTRGPLSAAPLLPYLDRKAFYSRGGCRVVKTVMPPSACVPGRQQQVTGTCGAGVILAQGG